MDKIEKIFAGVPQKRFIILLMVFSALLSLSLLSGRELESGDETRVAGIIMEMARSQNRLVPHLNGLPFLEYPPMYYWTGVLCLHLPIPADAAVKLPSALALCGSILLLFFLAGDFGVSGGKAFLTAVMLPLSISFFIKGRTCMVDAMLSFFILLALTGSYRAMQAADRRNRFTGITLYVIGSACAVMTKGLLGLILPGAVTFFFLLLSDIVRKKIGWTNWILLAIGSAAALIPVLIWYALLYWNSGFSAFYEAAYVNNIGRFTGSQGDHAESSLYYLKKMPEIFQPWLILIPFGLWQVFKQARHRSAAALFILCYFLVPLLCFSIASGKRVVYLLPIYPAAVLLAAAGLFFLIDRIPETRWNRISVHCRWILFLLLIGGSLILPLFRNDRACWLYAGIIFLYTPLAAFFSRKYWTVILLSTALFLPMAENALRGKRFHKESLRHLFKSVEHLEAQGKKVYLLDPAERTRGAASYYRKGKNMPVRKFSEYDGRQAEYWIVRDKHIKQGTKFGDSHHIVKMPEKLFL